MRRLESVSDSPEGAVAPEAGERFAFGENWARFLTLLTPNRIESAEASLCRMLGCRRLDGRRFLDIGSGSGLFSLAAHRLGAPVTSFDYDPRSVACTQELKRRYFPQDATWLVEAGSALDPDYMSRLGTFDIVYSWGVLHHTGDMWRALDLAVQRVASGGQLFIALYNDQGVISRYWSLVKRLYARHTVLRPLLVALHAPYLLGLRYLVRAMTGRLTIERGMSLWHDMIDWVGGFPFEVATPGAVVDALVARGFVLVKLKTCGGRSGCNEFVFCKALLSTPFYEDAP